jgi:tight adherence protein B
MVNAMVVQHSAGGNLARVLASMANILTERQRLDGEIKAMTAEPRFSALIIQLMPVALLVLTRNSPMGVALFETWPGWILLAIFALIQLGIFFLIRRIMRIEV